VANDSSIVVRYQLTRDDSINFHLYCVEHSPTAQRRLRFGRLFAALIAGVSVAALVILIAYFTQGGHIPASTGAVAILCAFGAAFLEFLIAPRSQRRKFLIALNKALDERGGQDYSKEHTLWLNQDGIVFSSDSGDETRVSWSSVNTLEVTEDYVYIFLDSTYAYTVPKMAFPDRSQCEEFVQVAREHLRISHNL
jgi:hypothetical protein